MNLKKIIFLTGILLPVSSAFAQYAEDALRFSQTESGATARFRGLGNAQTALGGDISSIAANPAGLGLFTKTEFNFTPGFRNSGINSKYLETNTEMEKTVAGIDQLGLAIYNPSRMYTNSSEPQKGLLSFNLGIAYNKTNNFNTTVDYTGNNNTSSFADYLSDLSNFYLPGGDPEVNASALPRGSLEKMAYNNFLTEYDANGYFATTAIDPVNNQQNTLYNSGSQSEVNLAVAGNYNNELYIGASLGFTSLSYQSDREFVERGNTRSYPNQPVDFVNAKYRLTYFSNQETEGSGVNAKLGLIYRASPSFRIGMNLVSPTWYSLDDNYSEKLDTYYTRANGTAITPAYTNSEEEYYLTYRLRTPYRLNGGIVYTFSNLGLITGDVEFVDFASTRFSTDNTSTENNVNKDIRNRYKSAVNYRIGAEAKIHPLLQVRAGYNANGNPYKNADFTSNTFSAGLGYRVKTFSFDLTFANRTTKYTTSPYVLSEDYPDFQTTGSGPVADIKNSVNSFYATIGLRF